MPLHFPYVQTTYNTRYIDVEIHHICGLTSNKKAECWGANGFGQLGDGTVESRAEQILSQYPAGKNGAK